MPIPVESYSWGRPAAGQEVRVTWSFTDFVLTNSFRGQFSGYPDFDYTLNEVWRPLVRQAFEAWDRVTGIDFVEVADSINSDIRIGQAYIDGEGSTLGTAQAWFSGSIISTAAIVLDSDSFDANDLFYCTVLHEIGHAIGIEHSSSPSDVMYAYNNRLQTLSAEDIAAGRSLYGPDASQAAVPPYVAQVARLYEAGLNRAFDAGGLNFWIDRFEAGQSLQSMAELFLDSAEFTTRFGDDDAMSNGAFARRMYLNVLDREPDQGGLAYWTSRLNGGESHGSVLANFALSPENVAATGYLGTLHQSTPGYWVL